MITIIHGDNIAASRKFFFDQKQNYPDAVLFDGEKMTLTDFAQILEGGGLFDDSKTVFIENLLGKKKKGDDSKEIQKYIAAHGDEHTIYIWENKELDKTTLNVFKTAKVIPFKLPQMLFQFLENIRPGNGKALVTLYRQTIETAEPEMVFFMLVRQVRLLLGVKSPANEPIDEVKRMAPWQKGRVEKQASYFSEEQLTALYKKLYQLEYGQKTGNLNANLTTAIDFLLVEI